MKDQKAMRECWRLLTPAEVAAELGLSRPYIYTLAAAGTLRSFRFGKAIRFHPDDVEDFIREHRQRKGKAA